MVQNPPCWMASYALGHSEQRKARLDHFLTEVIYLEAVTFFVFQHDEFCAMSPVYAKRLFEHERN